MAAKSIRKDQGLPSPCHTVGRYMLSLDVATAPEVFQHVVAQNFERLSNVFNVIDDIVIFARAREIVAATHRQSNPEATRCWR